MVSISLRAIGGSALTADVEVPKDRSDDAISHGVPITYVPARNLTFLAIAAGLAEVVLARDIYVGTNAVDYSGYPDCRRPFIDAFAAAANLGTKAGSESAEPWLRVRTPLSELTKAAIIRLGASLGVDYALTTSCYDPSTDAAGGPLACGRCDSCQIRRRGFEEAGVADPTRYA